MIKHLEQYMKQARRALSEGIWKASEAVARTGKLAHAMTESLQSIATRIDARGRCPKCGAEVTAGEMARTGSCFVCNLNDLARQAAEETGGYAVVTPGGQPS